MNTSLEESEDLTPQEEEELDNEGNELEESEDLTPQEEEELDNEHQSSTDENEMCFSSRWW